ncbi:hypothetical protein [Corynebacterium auris]|uniref:hypothetical protein n=1 Tax=Corynebacterium auris TaxID=44750 RepID=UPI0025B38D57|nr:hypothetical protein [Corynebacterium auris]
MAHHFFRPCFDLGDVGGGGEVVADVHDVPLPDAQPGGAGVARAGVGDNHELAELSAVEGAGCGGEGLERDAREHGGTVGVELRCQRADGEVAERGGVVA